MRGAGNPSCISRLAFCVFLFMPASFLKIERQKTGAIRFLWLALFFVYHLLFFLILLGFHNLVQNMIHYPQQGRLVFHELPVTTVFLSTVLGALSTGITYYIVLDNTLGKIRRIFCARPLNDSADEKRVANVIEEMSVACGSKVTIEGAVLPFSSLNILAVADGQGRGIVAVTQGALEKLSRARLEAAIAYEVGYIASGGARVNTTVAVAFTVYSAMFEGMVGFLPGLFAAFEDEKPSRDGEGDMRLLHQTSRYSSQDDPSAAGLSLVARLSPQLVIMTVMSYVFCVVAFFLATIVTKLMAMMVSRSLGDKADAVAVRLTRDPRSLAEAIYIMAYHARGSELPVGRYFHPIFFVHPAPSAFDEQEGFWGDLFGTHSPASARIDRLLRMAHVDPSELEGLVPDLTKVVPYAPFSGGEIKAPSQGGWQVLEGGVWQGPYDLSQIQTLSFFHAGLLVRRDADDIPRKAGEMPDFIGVLALLKPKDLAPIVCPGCQKALFPLPYEGVSVEGCRSCFGVLAEAAGVKQILDRQEVAFSPEIMAEARALWSRAAKDDTWRGAVAESPFDCPVCKGQVRMRRSAYSQDYPVEIDRCPSCQRVWFDRHELEILQFLYESRLR